MGTTLTTRNEITNEGGTAVEGGGLLRRKMKVKTYNLRKKRKLGEMVPKVCWGLSAQIKKKIA